MKTTQPGTRIDLTDGQCETLKGFVNEHTRCGEPYYLLAQPMIYAGTLTVVLLTEKQGRDLGAWLTKRGLAKGKVKR